MKLTLYVWRQKSAAQEGEFRRYDMQEVSPDSSFLEVLDLLNEQLILKGEEPIEFEHDCREGICGCCSMVINGRPHGPKKLHTTCQLHMRNFEDGATVYVEPWRAAAFPVVKDLVVDRSSFDRIIQSGGYISVNTGSAPEANSVPIGKEVIDTAMDAATCIGCGACVAACPNGSAALFTAAKISHLGLLAQGQPERYDRVLRMVDQMDKELFGSCTNHGECQEACPKGISIKYISMMNRDFIRATAARVMDPKGAMKAQ
ncbi:MAG: succinate dehydrogenase/fumarate reductase iron-sulfur subunit [Bdellovibrionota bacterium]|nr:MAG: succinate dehydrogenase/fumarate reductase iron-sulfur subunit [Bdellovibrionota bacterium]